MFWFQRNECSPRNCGNCWLGDNLCQKELDEHTRQRTEFERLYVLENVACEVCSAKLTSYEIPTDTLWVWPGVWPDGKYYSPMIALSIFAVIGAPKGEIHEFKKGGATFHHVFVGRGEYREEKLIKLTGGLQG